MAKKMQGGSSKNGRKTAGKRLGIKKFGGEVVTTSSIIVRQKGTRYQPGPNTYLGRNHDILASVNGHVSFGKNARGTVISVVAA